MKVQDNTTSNTSPPQAIVQAVTSTDNNVNVYAEPFITSALRGQLTTHHNYPVLGTDTCFLNEPAMLIPGVPYANPSRWWQFSLSGDASFQALNIGEGWVLSNMVEEHCVSHRVPVTWPPPVVIGAPQDLQSTLSGVTGTRITLSWTAPELPAGTTVTGYRIERYLQDGTEAVIDVLGSGTRWTDPTEFPAGTYLIYSVAALVGTDVGTRSVPHNVVSGGGVFAAAIGSHVEVKEDPVGPVDPKPAVGYMSTTRSYGVIGWLEDVRTGFEDWIKIQIARVTNRDPRGVRLAGQLTVGWVRLSQVTLTGSLADVPTPALPLNKGIPHNSTVK